MFILTLNHRQTCFVPRAREREREKDREREREGKREPEVKYKGHNNWEGRVTWVFFP